MRASKSVSSSVHCQDCFMGQAAPGPSAGPQRGWASKSTRLCVCVGVGWVSGWGLRDTAGCSLSCSLGQCWLAAARKGASSSARLCHLRAKQRRPLGQAEQTPHGRGKSRRHFRNEHCGCGCCCSRGSCKPGGPVAAARLRFWFFCGIRKQLTEAGVFPRPKTREVATSAAAGAALGR